jgi:hypothetical protein
MVNYKRSKIYKIQPINAGPTDKVYFGSSANPYLSARLAEHTTKFNLWLEGKYRVKSALFDLFLEEAPENCEIVLLETYPCSSKDELNQRRIHWYNKCKVSNKLTD